MDIIQSTPHTQGYLDRLAIVLSPAHFSLLMNIADAAQDRNQGIYLVGGAVRDLIMGREISDYDLVLEGDAIHVARTLAEKYGGKVTAHTRFRTAAWILDDQVQDRLGIPEGERKNLRVVDLISARTETYTRPAALPTIHLGSLDHDLRRRDFTINTLAMRMNGSTRGELYDSLGGLEDLQQGWIRVLHPRSFVDDPTRLFRAVRYEQRYQYTITPDTEKLVQDALPGIDLLSAQRVRHELDLIMEEEHAAHMLERLMTLGILPQVHPTLRWTPETAQRFQLGQRALKTQVIQPTKKFPRWAWLLMDQKRGDLEKIDSRLHFEAAMRKGILAAADLFANTKEVLGKRPSQCAAILDEYPLPAVQAVMLCMPDNEIQAVLRKYLEIWRGVKPITTGHALMLRCIPPGPRYKIILKHLRDAWLDGEIKDQAGEGNLLKKLIDPENKPDG